MFFTTLSNYNYSYKQDFFVWFNIIWKDGIVKKIILVAIENIPTEVTLLDKTNYCNKWKLRLFIRKINDESKILCGGSLYFSVDKFYERRTSDTLFSVWRLEREINYQDVRRFRHKEGGQVESTHQTTKKTAVKKEGGQAVRHRFARERLTRCSVSDV